MTPDDFIDRIAPDAKKCAAKTGIPASFTVAQAALESGWGVHTPANNLFGIKADPSWKGDFVDLSTTEYIDGVETKVMAKFRAYPDWLSSLLDHAAFLTKNKRYEPAFACHDGESFAKAVAAAGYATAPNYAEEICAVIKAHALDALDQIPA